MGNEQSQRVELAGKTGVFACRDMKIDGISDDVLKINKLRVVDMSNNKIKKINENIGNCNSLTSLILDKNYIEQVGEAVGKCVKLEILSLNENRISHPLPNSLFAIEGCTQLKKILLSHNKITTLFTNETIESSYKSFSSFNNLVLIDLSFNNLKAIPSQLCLFPFLEEINVNDNQITEITDDIGGGNQHLHIIRIQNNLISDPKRISPLVLKDSSIDNIELEGNPVMKLGNPQDVIEGYAEYLEKRRKRVDKQIYGGLHPSLK